MWTAFWRYRMKSCCLIFAAIFLFPFVALPQDKPGLHDGADATSQEQSNAGVVVEQAAKNSAAEKADIHEGDIIFRWMRGDANGRILTPFDLSWVEIEQGPRGTITLEGLRNNEKLAWKIGAGDWSIASRPNLHGTLLSTYREGQDLANAGKLPEAVERWRMGARQIQQSQNKWVGPWFLFHSAEALAAAHLWKEADRAYQGALDAASEPIEVAQVLRRRGRLFQQQHEWDQAEKYYRQALAEARKLGAENLFAARCMNNLGGLFIRRGEVGKAEEQYLKALAIRQELAPDSLEVADSLDSLALVEDERGNFRKAEEYARQVLAITERLSPDSLDLAIELNNLGYTMLREGDLDAAAPFFQRALALEEKFQPESIATASTLTNLGDIAWKRGNLGKAEEYHRRSLQIRQQVSPSGLEHSAGLHNLALIYTDRGDLIEGEKLYLQAVAILEKLAPAGYEISVCFTNLGALNWFRGDLDTAGGYYRRALTIAEKIGPESTHIAGLLGNLGNISQQQGNMPAAREYFLKALSISEKVAPASLDMAGALNNLAGLEQQETDSQHSKEHYERALQIEEKAAPYGASAAHSLNHLGDLAARENDLSKAEAYYRHALAIREKLSTKNADYVESLASLASLLRRRGQIEEAANLFSKGLDALENQIAILGGEEETSSNFRAKHVNDYKEFIDLLIQQKQPDLAFQVFERLRARELLTILAAHIDLSNGGGSSLIARQRSLAADIAAKSSRRVRLFSNDHAEAQILPLDKEIHELQTQLDNVNSEIRKSNPDYAALTQPRTLSVKEVQEHLLDPDTVLLEYDLGEERSYLWLVDRDSIFVYELAKRSEIEAAARRLRGTLVARNAVNKNEAEADRLSRAKEADAQYPAAAAELGRMILGPVASRIGHKRLLVVSDGILQYIPLAVLMVPGGPETTAASWSPLINDHEVVNLPSASVLDVLKRQRAGRRTAAKTLAVLADPVFDPHDARLRTAQPSSKVINEQKPAPGVADDLPAPHKLSESLMFRSAAKIGMINEETSFPRLFFARSEAEAILQGIPAEQRLKALDFAASRATAMSQELHNYRIVHFATHGLLNSEHPELSGLVLSLVDAQGKQQNGFLNLRDIYNLNLRADLVVLSACETGLGKEVQGEGLVGVARGFMHAGASSVVASLWKVDDLATAEFMKIFYKGMLNDKLPPAAALRRAQIEMNKRRPAPYFWAGFILQGAL